LNPPTARWKNSLQAACDFITYRSPKAFFYA
jgi:hypothetical protein